MHRIVLSAAAALVGAMPSATSAAPLERTSAELLNLEHLVTGEDYPPEAQMADEQGTVDVLVKVDEAGRVADCTIEGSSGSAALDVQTCRLFWLRAKFAPARNEAGKPVVSAYSRKITWRLEGEGMPVGLWASRLFVAIDANGAANCRAEFVGVLKDRMKEEYPDHGKGGCAELVGELPTLALSQAARGAPGTVVIEQRLIPGEQLSSAPPTSMPGRILYQALLHLEIAEDGKLTKCTQVRSEGTFSMPDPCQTFPKVFRKPVGKDKRPASVKATGIVTSSAMVDSAASVRP